MILSTVIPAMTSLMAVLVLILFTVEQEMISIKLIILEIK